MINLNPGWPIVLAGGPAAWDSGWRWVTGRIVDWLPADADPPGSWVFTCWAPWAGEFRQYAYVYAGVQQGAIVLNYAGALASYDPRIQLGEDGDGEGAEPVARAA